MEKISSLTSFSTWTQYNAPVLDRRNIFRIFKNAYRDLKHDLKNTRWLRGFGWFGAVCWFVGLVMALTVLGIASVGYSDTACQPDGSFRLHPETYSMWSSSGFFQITLGGGKLTFAQAKGIDIAWDIGVGRGGQFFLAFLSWRVFAKYLTVCMETQPITYQLFRTIFLERDVSLPSTCRSIKSLLLQRKLRSKLAMAFIIGTMIFLLAFPTLASAMSGYDANVAAYLPDKDLNLIPFRDFSRVFYVIHDGWRINQTGNFWVMDNEPYDGEPLLTSKSRCSRHRMVNYTEYNCQYTYSSVHCVEDSRECNLQNSVSAYVIAHGLGGTKNVSTRFDDWTTGNNFTLDAPALNISAYKTNEPALGGQNSSGLLKSQSWVRENRTYTIEYVEQEGSCQTLGHYRWGFSFLQLLVFVILLFIWTIGIYTIWLRTHFTMALRQRHPDDISGEHRAVIELADAMQRELDIHDVHPSLLRERELREQVNEQLKGGAISYAYAKANVPTYHMWKAFKSWLKKEKWWFGAIFLTSVMCSTLWMSWKDWYFWFWTFGLWLGQCFAFAMGTTKGSRALIILFWCVISSIVIIIVSAKDPLYLGYYS